MGTLHPQVYLCKPSLVTTKSSDNCRLFPLYKELVKINITHNHLLVLLSVQSNERFVFL